MSPPPGPACCSAPPPGEGDLALVVPAAFLRRFELSPPPSESNPDPPAAPPPPPSAARFRFEDDDEREEGPGEELRLVEDRPEGDVARFARYALPLPPLGVPARDGECCRECDEGDWARLWPGCGEVCRLDVPPPPPEVTEALSSSSSDFCVSLGDKGPRQH